MKRIAEVTDATLREGSQTRSGSFTQQQSAEIASLLVRAGISMVECGHPMISDKERNRVKAVVEACGSVPVLTHARLRREDIMRAAESGASWVGIFVGVNDTSRKSRMSWESLDNLYQLVRNEVSFARELNLEVRFTIEDATRTPMQNLLQTFSVAKDAGARRLCISDTVGCLEPPEVARIFKTISNTFPDSEIEGHFHDDRGLAMANALVAVDAGATSISTSINSLGERAGITDTATFMINQHLRSRADLPPPGLLQDLSRRVGAYSRSHPDDRRPFVGRNAFHHASRLHVRATHYTPSAYEVVDPAILGRTRSTGQEPVPVDLEELVVKPPIISATELRHHRHGPGERYVLMDNRFVASADQYLIARRLPHGAHPSTSHVDPHVHHCDSLFGFLGEEPNYTGLMVEVQVGEQRTVLESPASVFIPAGVEHSYRAIKGAGTYLNYVLSGSYEESLLDPAPLPMLFEAISVKDK